MTRSFAQRERRALSSPTLAAPARLPRGQEWLPLACLPCLVSLPGQVASLVIFIFSARVQWAPQAAGAVVRAMGGEGTWPEALAPPHWMEEAGRAGGQPAKDEGQALCPGSHHRLLSSPMKA